VRWWRIKRRMSLDWMVNWSWVVIVWFMCVCVFWGWGFVRHWTWKWQWKVLKVYKSVRVVDCSISIEFFKSGQQTASMPLIFRLEVLKYK